MQTPSAADALGGHLSRGGDRKDELLLKGQVKALLPTPMALESTPTDEFLDEVREHIQDPHERLYLPGRKWHSQRTLSRIVMTGTAIPTGVTTPPPSDVGNESTDPPPRQLTIGDA